MSRPTDICAPTEQLEGTRSQLLRWLRQVGDPITADEPLIELETDKVTVEIPAPTSGVLSEICKQAGDEIEPGTLLGRIADHGASTPAPTVASKDTPPHEAVVRRVANDSRVAASSLERLSPAVQRLLAERGLNVDDVEGSGKGGRITVDDVLSSPVRRATVESSVLRPVADALAPPATPGVRRVPHSPMRKRIAERMVASLLHTAPHVTTVFELDLSAVLAHRARHREEFEQRGAPLTLTAYFVSACVDALRAVPEVNSRWYEDALEIFENYDIGVATSLEDRGLVVPVVRDVQTLGLFEIADRLNDVVHRAREDRLTPADVRGGTFTISNHGVSGSVFAAPIVIPQPQSAILGIGKLERRAVVVENAGATSIEARPRCYVSLTLDHRVLDGHSANRFLSAYVARLESWSDPVSP